jgi:hypothetical protein
MGGLENKRLDSSGSDGSLQPGIVEVALDRNERMSNGVSIIRTRLLGDNSCSCVSYLQNPGTICTCSLIVFEILPWYSAGIRADISYSSLYSLGYPLSRT